MCKAVIDQILENKIIVIVRGVKKEHLIPFAEAIYAGGIRLLECTYDARGITPAEETAENIAMLVSHFGDRMAIGAGTVLTERQVELTKEAGGKFIISPDTNTAIIEATKKCGLVSIPGAMTPSEITTAHNAGADFVKLFPTDALGSRYIKSITAPLSHVRILAVGGVSDSNMAEFFEAGACGIGIGSSVVNKKLIEEGDFATITELAKRYTDKL